MKRIWGILLISIYILAANPASSYGTDAPCLVGIAELAIFKIIAPPSSTDVLVGTGEEFLVPVEVKYLEISGAQYEYLKKFAQGNLPAPGLRSEFSFPESDTLSKEVRDADSSLEALLFELRLKSTQERFVYVYKKVGTENAVTKNCTQNLPPNQKFTDPESSEPIVEQHTHDGDPGKMAIDNPNPPQEQTFRLPIEGKYDARSTLRSYGFGPRLLNSRSASLYLMSQSEIKNPISFDAYVDLFRIKNKVLRIKNPAAVKHLPRLWNRHIGVDFAVPEGTPFKAVSDGQVYAAGNLGCPGNTLVVQHQVPGGSFGDIAFTSYKHILKATVSPGDFVKKGQTIGYSGKSGIGLRMTSKGKVGCVSGAHLHFEVRQPVSSEALFKILSEPLRSEVSTTISRKKGASKIRKTNQNQKRLALIESLTASVNPADYIKEIDDVCIKTKITEIKNSLLLLDLSKEGLLGPLTMSYCSVKAEAAIKAAMLLDGKNTLPFIYQIKDMQRTPQIPSKRRR